MYDWKKEQLRRQLNQEYFEKIRKQQKGEVVSSQMLLFYRLCAMFTIGSVIGFMISIF